mmetsp:Transcript_1192/g.2745  ORF Transcript_1192/g.2745 Transcript_1192/m.2745 type:complete len:249 (-) Transcript_1192:545-1291(-)
MANQAFGYICSEACSDNRFTPRKQPCCRKCLSMHCSRRCPWEYTTVAEGCVPSEINSAFLLPERKAVHHFLRLVKTRMPSCYWGTCFVLNKRKLNRIRIFPTNCGCKIFWVDHEVACKRSILWIWIPTTTFHDCHKDVRRFFWRCEPVEKPICTFLLLFPPTKFVLQKSGLYFSIPLKQPHRGLLPASFVVQYCSVISEHRDISGLIDERHVTLDICNLPNHPGEDTCGLMNPSPERETRRAVPDHKC